jgi:hypothetical protein
MCQGRSPYRCCPRAHAVNAASLPTDAALQASRDVSIASVQTPAAQASLEALSEKSLQRPSDAQRHLPATSSSTGNEALACTCGPICTPVYPTGVRTQRSANRPSLDTPSIQAPSLIDPMASAVMGAQRFLRTQPVMHHTSPDLDRLACPLPGTHIFWIPGRPSPKFALPPRAAVRAHSFNITEKETQ